MQYIIIGADGYIGSYLYKHLQADGFRVWGTSRRNKAGKNKIFFDMESSHSLCVEGVDWEKTTVILCAAQSKIDNCAKDYVAAYRLNVTRTAAVAAEMLSRGANVIAFSSDQVFDGSRGNYTEADRKNPLNAYGSMKAEMEERLLELNPAPCIFRIAKTLSSEDTDSNLFYEWQKKAPHGRIRCIQDNIITFVYLQDIYHALRVADMARLQGIYHIAGDEAVSRAELARSFLTVAGLAGVVVCEEPIEKFAFLEPRPLNVSMDNSFFKSITGFSFTPLADVLQDYMHNHDTLL